MATYTITICDERGGRVGVTATCLPAADDPVGAPSPAEIETEWAMDMLQVKDPDRRTIIRLVARARAEAGAQSWEGAQDHDERVRVDAG